MRREHKNMFWSFANFVILETRDQGERMKGYLNKDSKIVLHILFHGCFDLLFCQEKNVV